MLASSPAFLKCFECKKSPKQFTFLLCNHIVCEKCIPTKIEFRHNHNLVVCSCGCLTYFNQDSEIMQKQIQQDQQAKKKSIVNFVARNISALNERCSKIEQGHSQTKNLSKQTVDKFSKTLINERSSTPMLQVSEVFSLEKNDPYEQSKYQKLSSPQKQTYINGCLLTTEMLNHLTGSDKTKYEQSLLLDSYQCYEPVRKNEKQELRTINQFSTHQIQTENNDSSIFFNQDKLKHSSLLKQLKYIKSSATVPPTSNKTLKVEQTQVQQRSFQPQGITRPSHGSNNIGQHSQFHYQLCFLQIMFKKDVEQIEFQFRKVVQKIIKSYKKMEEDLRSLYIEQVITKQSLISMNLSSIVRKKYEKKIGSQFKALKSILFKPFYYDNRHNQNNRLFNNKYNINPSLPGLQKFKPFQNNRFNNSFNVSQMIDQSDANTDKSQSQSEGTTMKNKMATNFETIEQKLQRLTTKKDHQAKDSKKNHVRMYNDESSKRIQTQNIHTNIKRNQSQDKMNKNRQQEIVFQNNKNLKHQQIECYNQLGQHYRLTSKPNQRKTHKISSHENNHNEHKRRQIVYFSPPVPYCYKHLQKRQREAKNYISYIEKLCHQKKMKNHQELFKKAKTGYAFVGRNFEKS